MTLPPSPPSPPSGPPRGTYFSRRKLQQPRPPSPPLTYSVTRSTNMGRKPLRRITQVVFVVFLHDTKRRPGATPDRRATSGRGSSRVRGGVRWFVPTDRPRRWSTDDLQLRQRP